MVWYILFFCCRCLLCLCFKKTADGFEIHDVKRLLNVGSEILFRFGDREAPAIFFEKCKSVKIENVTVNSSPGMGVICQGCTDVSLDRYSVSPSKNTACRKR